ncbi:hypothetical protein BOTNAR_0291g00140 [Botryotinia narcissicola]|uniref:Uncharacterized protein n=1 Tax=Botryotinia narcissicola TaxID=278944 RepID=A0A4Z1HY39_9HELO|nr:hypothetical protein BOTNAR_0291g00140 [Botryotinia narcissicola]
MKLSTYLPILAGTLAVALPTEALTKRDNKFCVTQGRDDYLGTQLKLPTSGLLVLLTFPKNQKG